MKNRTCAVATVVLCSLVAVRAGHAGQDTAPPSSRSAPASSGQPSRSGGPSDLLPPIAPDVLVRDESGHATVRATRVTMPIRRDGRLDEAVYEEVLPISDFIQMQPQPGAVATNKTEVWVLFDDQRIYVTARCWESDPKRMALTPMKRDNLGLSSTESFGFVFDTLHDRRSGFGFLATPLGAYSDGQITNGSEWNIDFNPVWDVTVGRFDGGWSVEAAIPFKSLRYQSERTQTWGFQAMRNNRWKNEQSYVTRVPISRGGATQGFMSVADFATMVGLEAPPASLNLEIKPYVTGSLASDRTVSPPLSSDPDGDFGLDMKYGLTRSLAADFTYNPDFAQVEVDEQQVNLTRFSLQFPEKREFFLENQGLFAFGGAGARGGGTSETPILFYSRRIGLNGGRAIPLRGGGRVTGRVGAYMLGLLSIESDDDPVLGSPATNFSVVRVKRDIFRRSSIGVLYTGRSVSQAAAGRNDVYGVDGTFDFFDNLGINTYWARSRTASLPGNASSYRAQLDYAGDRYGLQLERLTVGDHFNPEIGFMRREDMRRSFGQFRFSPRPRAMKHVRRFSAVGSVEYIENNQGTLESRELVGDFAVEFHRGDRLSARYTDAYEFVPRPFAIAPGVVLPVAVYRFDNLQTTMVFGQQRPLSGNLTFEHGTFYDGHKTTVGFSSGRVNIMTRLVMEPTISINRVNLREGSFTNSVVGSRVSVIITPRLFASALVQYGSASHAAATNVRLRWEYQPGSELFLVYSEQRDTRTATFLDLANRAFLVKFNRLFRF